MRMERDAKRWKSENENGKRYQKVEESLGH